jgi:hypothetical protein
VVSSWALTIFPIDYALANIAGGIPTRHIDPKTVMIVGFTHFVAVLLLCRFIRGGGRGPLLAAAIAFRQSVVRAGRAHDGQWPQNPGWVPSRTDIQHHRILHDRLRGAGRPGDLGGLALLLYDRTSNAVQA